MGGDEFVVVAPAMPADAVRDKAALLSTLAQQAGRMVCGQDLLSLSVGAAFYPQDGTDVEQLLAEADRKMYVVKQAHHETSEKSLFEGQPRTRTASVQ
jgi:diguanylate cyclase (GGDEF)-like protein